MLYFLLFICAGCIIHNVGGYQDIRYIGALVSCMPLTCTFFIISNLSLCGLPFLAGFYSKDLVLEVLSMRHLNIYIYVIFFLSTGLTVCYTFRLLYYVIVGDFNYLSLNSISDIGLIMLKGIRGLIFMVVLAGRILIWLIFPTPYFICLPNIIKIIALLVSLFGAWIGYEVSKISLNYKVKSMEVLGISLFLSFIWNMPYVSTYGINYYPLYRGKVVYETLDQGWSEYLGGQNFYNNIVNMSKYLQFLYNNNLKVFLLLIVIWVIFMVLFL
jgi:NADH-ubiquinone oxidoreductase chain 5